MDSALKALLIAGGIIITVLVIGIGFTVYNKSKSASDTAIDEMDSITTQLNESKYTNYDGTSITGSELINVIKKFKADKICITVNNGVKDTEYLWNASFTQDLTGDLTQMIKDASDIANTNTVYINPNAKFDGEVIRNSDTNGITGLKFVIAK